MGTYHLMGLGLSPGAVARLAHRYGPRAEDRQPRPQTKEIMEQKGT